MKRLFVTALIAATLALTLAGCGANGNETGGAPFAVGMVTDQAGINDQSFNQSAWSGMVQLRDNIGAEIGYLESDTIADKSANMDRFYDLGKDIIWVIGWAGAEPLTQQADINPGQIYGIVDYSFGDDIQPNVVAIEFRENEATFLAGYMAAQQTSTGVVGFIGGQEISVILRFQAGFEAGVAYANNVHGLDAYVLVRYVGDWYDVALARGISAELHTLGADVLYAAAGGAGQGAIDFAIANDLYVIGVDVDQSHLAPNHMITSTLKNVGAAIYDVSARLYNGENVGGQNLVFGLAEGGVGITPFEGSTANLVDPAVHASAMELAARIASGDLQIPSDASGLQQFLNNL